MIRTATLPTHSSSCQLRHCSHLCVGRVATVSLTCERVRRLWRCRWSPALQIRHVLLSIQALMSTPNPDDPLANDIAEVWKTDLPRALALAREWTGKYASA